MRIPLQINSGKLILTCVFECKSLRIRRQIAKFVIDTGSSESYISMKDSVKFQIPLNNKKCTGEVDFGGSRFDKISLPKFNMYVLEEDNSKNKFLLLKINISALRSNKNNKLKLQVAESLPSILGLNFLKEQKLSLHVIMAEDVAYLELNK
jgi:hypothetical protein